MKYFELIFLWLFKYSKFEMISHFDTVYVAHFVFSCIGSCGVAPWWPFYDCLNVRFSSECGSGFMFFVWRCVFMFKFFCVCFLMEHGGKQWVKIRPVDIVYVAPFFVLLWYWGWITCLSPTFYQGFGTVLFEMQITTRWRHSLLFSHEEGKDDGKRKEREKNFEFVVTTFCRCWCQMGSNEDVFCAESGDFPVWWSLSTWNDIDVLIALLCVDVVTLSISLHPILPLTPSVSGFCPFLWTTLCVFTRCWCRDWK